MLKKPVFWRLLEGTGLGLPQYYEWRTRSGCTFCFFQQKIEWVRLMERHPDFFEEAKGYEKNAIDHGSPFTWSEGESLDELSQAGAGSANSGLNTNVGWRANAR